MISEPGGDTIRNAFRIPEDGNVYNETGFSQGQNNSLRERHSDAQDA